MSNTAHIQAIRNFNSGKGVNPYCPETDRSSHRTYNEKMEYLQSRAYEQEQRDTHFTLGEGE